MTAIAAQKSEERAGFRVGSITCRTVIRASRSWGTGSGSRATTGSSARASVFLKKSHLGAQPKVIAPIKLQSKGDSSNFRGADAAGASPAPIEPEPRRTKLMGY
jgi:hypothetical protein